VELRTQGGAVHQAWELLRERYLFLSSEEASPNWGPARAHPKTRTNCKPVKSKSSFRREQHLAAELRRFVDCLAGLLSPIGLISYYGPVTLESAAVTEYGQQFASVIEKHNVWAVQFHPEKSGQVGLAVLSNFLSSCRAPTARR
jgi:hypothetical protein